jgi:N-terminal acetyltransferase B complex non-catalytic subunit
VHQKPTDETTLSILSHSLKPLDRPLDLIGIYQHAWDAAPKSEEMGAQTFVAHVRTGRWSGARLTGMKLWKAFNVERYFWWSIMAGVMQAERPFPPSPIPVLVMIPTRAQLAEREAAFAKDKALSKEILYGLAWRMAGTAPKESAPTPERIWLQASVAVRSATHYEELGKEKEAKEMWAKALEVLESEAGERASTTALHVEELRREVAAKSGQWEKEYGHMKECLEKGYAFRLPVDQIYLF